LERVVLTYPSRKWVFLQPLKPCRKRVPAAGRAENRKMPWAESPRAFFCRSGAVRVLGANADYIGLAYHHNSTRTGAVPGNVSLAMPITADEPLLVKPIGMLGDTGKVYRLIGSRLLGHPLTALFATFSRHSFLLLALTYMKTDRPSARVPVPISNLW
jgi:hypothetical protein